MHIIKQRFARAIFHRGWHIGFQHRLPAFIGAVAHILAAGLFPAFHILAVAERRLVEGRLIVAHGMRRPQKMPPGCHLFIGIGGKRVFRQVQPL